MENLPDSNEQTIQKLEAKIAALQRENAILKNRIVRSPLSGNTVKVPESMRIIFDLAEQTVGDYFKNIIVDPSKATIDISGHRYVLVRASSLSIDFFQKLLDLYADKGKDEAIQIGRNFLFDIAHMIGMEDARNFHEVMKLKNPIEKLSAGPVHFAYSGWAYVDIDESSNPSPDDNFVMRFKHPFSFEADSWIRAGKKSDHPVCIMNSGYSSGWCEASFGIPLTTVEVTCRAKGDSTCSFIMAPPHRIHEHLEGHLHPDNHNEAFDVPLFFERKAAEEKIKSSLKEKEILLKEIHHRVKNNLQIISSLLRLQSAYINDEEMLKVVNDSRNRIKTMAIVHEKLYQTNLGSVNLGDYLHTVAESTDESYNVHQSDIRIRFENSEMPVQVKIDFAIPVGLIINEVFTNAYKYAFKEKSSGEIYLSLRHPSPNLLVIETGDNGRGMGEDVDMKTSETFGIELIRMLTEQLDGDVVLTKRNGTHFVFSFPIEQPE
jgi:two-component sensor histidine kinase/predicted hydrocarbon binding protein